MKALLAALAVAASLITPAHADNVLMMKPEGNNFALLLDESSSWCNRWAKDEGHRGAKAGVIVIGKPGAKFGEVKDDGYIRLCWSINDAANVIFVQGIDLQGYPIASVKTDLPISQFIPMPQIGRDFFTYEERFPR